MRYLIVSLPKSGTHLLKAIFNAYGGPKTELYFGLNRITKKYHVSHEINLKFGSNRGEWHNFLKDYPFAYFNEKEFENPELMLLLIRDKECGISHLCRMDIPCYLDTGFQYIVLHRSMDEMIASAFNAEFFIRKNYPEKLEPAYNRIDWNEKLDILVEKFINEYIVLFFPHVLDFLYWKFHKNAFFISYNDIINKSSNFFKLADFVGMKSHQTFDLSQLNSTTKTMEKIITSSDVNKYLQRDPLYCNLNENINESFFNL